MNETINVLLNHRSIRKFSEQTINDEQLNAIISSAQMASTSSNVQAYSVIQVADPSKREKLEQMTGNQKHVSESPLFLVWCADLHRLKLAYSKQADAKDSYFDTAENLIVATVDTALAAQNATIAAESMGMGIVYIGGIRTQIRAVSELLQLPDLVFPLFGMCIGYPNQEVDIKPRLPMEAVLHLDHYDASKLNKILDSYDMTMSSYINIRTHGKINKTWTQDMLSKYSVPTRMHMKAFLEEQGFNLR